MLSSAMNISALIWSRYLAGVLIAWLLLVGPAGLAAALALGWPLSALLMTIEPYLDPHFEEWVYGDRARRQDPWRPLSQWDAPRDKKGPLPGSIGARLPD